MQKISETQATIENATVETVETVKDAGTAAPIVLAIIAAVGLLVLVRK
jgi:hypothetical protein